MAVFRVERTRDYTILSNHHLRNGELSLKAKGLLSMMLSLPDEWNYTTRGLASICKEGVESIGTTLKELENAGYIVRNKLRDERGRISDTEYVIYERPQQPHIGSSDTGSPDTENPYTVEPDMDAPYTENSTQLNTNQENKKAVKTDAVSNHQSIPRALDAYREVIKRNIEYDILAQNYGRERVDEIVELMLDVIGGRREAITISGAQFPAETVKSRFLKITVEHIEYVFDALDKQVGKIRNIRAYMLAALYNAPATIDSFYRAEYQRDRGGGRC
ncbi:MAG: helix-turn-helix domain-containing protein [Clostridiales bacterium]|jgi:hypothetical protein|nr:helix-turn-helix domain-containing protein [Clostridiales bacterium]